MRRRRKIIHGCRPRVFDSMHAWPLLGLDEVGTGSIAGPIAVAGIVMPAPPSGLPELLAELGLKDSKMMSAASRERVFDLIEDQTAFRSVKFSHPREIEEIGQGRALDRLFNEVISEFRYVLGHRETEGRSGSILIDGSFRKRLDYFHVGVPQGDQKSLTIAAASVYAKVLRDRMMCELAKDFPGYGLENNMGYLTKRHRSGLEKLGVAEIHRKNTKPVQALIDGLSPSVGC